MSKFPSQNAFVTIINDENWLTVAIKGHQTIERCLNTLIALKFSKSSNLELKRLSFPLRVDLAIALSLLPAPAKSVLNEINKIRNEAAHDVDFELNETSAKRLRTIVEQSFPHFKHTKDEDKGHLHCFRKHVLIAYLIIESAYRQVVERHAYDSVLVDMLNKLDLPELTQESAINRKISDATRSRLEEIEHEYFECDSQKKTR